MAISRGTALSAINRFRNASRDGTAIRAQFGSEALAVGTAALIESLFALGFALARKSTVDPGYLALALVLTLAAALICAAAGALLSRTAGARMGLTLYVLTRGLLASNPRWNTLSVVLVPCAEGVITWVVLAPSRSRELGLIARGTAIGGSLCAAMSIWGYLGPLMGVLAVAPWQGAVQQVSVYLLVLFAAVSWEVGQRRVRIMPSLASVSIPSLAIGLAATAIVVEHARPQSVAFERIRAQAVISHLPNVFVIVLDTVRADHLSLYGYERDTTPDLARFLTRNPGAIRYEFAYSPASWTIPAHASLLTGAMPSVHGADSGDHEDIAYSATESIAITADRTLAEVLHRAGYCTSAVVANAHLLRVDGLRRGFDAFIEPQPARRLRVVGEDVRNRFFSGMFAGQLKPYPLAESVNRDVLRSLSECGGQPAFVLANYMDAHAPYLAPPPHSGLFAGPRHTGEALGDALLTDPDDVVALKRDRYDESIHYLDSQVASLLARLAEVGALEDSWLFITADHGEAFREHGTTSHGSSIYNEQVRIPLIVKPPSGVELPRSREPVSLLDVSATIAALAGQEEFGTGRDLRRPLPSDRTVAIEFSGGFRRAVDEFGATADDPARAVVSGHFKLLERNGRYELYDLSADPNELAPLEGENDGVWTALAAALPAARMPHATRDEAQRTRRLGPDERERLRALGYLR